MKFQYSSSFLLILFFFLFFILSFYFRPGVQTPVRTEVMPHKNNEEWRGEDEEEEEDVGKKTEAKL